MSSPYIPNTPADQAAMLRAIGVSTLEELFSSIPSNVRLKRPLKLEGPWSEFDVRHEVDRLTRTTQSVARGKIFLGGGLYDHFSPAIVNQLTLRGEFLTAYTPYQPEISQGTLQVLFEYQSMMASLFAMDISNASHYDGATSLADGILMCLRVDPKIRRVLLPEALHPDYASTARTYLADLDIEVLSVPTDETSGVMDLRALEGLLSSPAAVVVQNPNYLGNVESLERVSKAVRAGQSKLITVCAEPLSLGILKPPGAFGADVAVGEGQSFGIAPSFGGPLLGIFTTRREYLRQLPGRVCGMTKDANGERSFTLTLSTREQHIRRQKATSNICTNQNLCVVMATIYLSLLGKRGLSGLAQQNLALSTYLKRRAKMIKGATLPYSGATFNEFVVRFPKHGAEDICRAARESDGIVLGHPLTEVGKPSDLLVAVTETKSRADLDTWISTCEKALNALG